MDAGIWEELFVKGKVIPLNTENPMWVSQIVTVNNCLVQNKVAYITGETHMKGVNDEEHTA